ncbi:MAG: hypothetical protein AAF989_05770 [Planctomycetota bacterium]
MAFVTGALWTIAPVPCEAQVTVGQKLSALPRETATLEEQLTNRLRAVTDDQRAFVKHIVRLVEQKRLDIKLVVAVERYALKRNRTLPFPYFERVIRFQAERRGITVPTVRQFANTRATDR